jgi:hypothetical protein
VHVSGLGVRGDGVNHWTVAVVVTCMRMAGMWLVAVMGGVLVLGVVMM